MSRLSRRRPSRTPALPRQRVRTPCLQRQLHSLPRKVGSVHFNLILKIIVFWKVKYGVVHLNIMPPFYYFCNYSLWIDPNGQAAASEKRTRNRCRFIVFIVLPVYLPHQSKVILLATSLEIGYRTHLAAISRATTLSLSLWCHWTIKTHSHLAVFPSVRRAMDIGVFNRVVHNEQFFTDFPRKIAWSRFCSYFTKPLANDK